MGALTDTVKQMLNALAFADAGEYLTPPAKGPPVKSQRQPGYHTLCRLPSAHAYSPASGSIHGRRATR